LWRIQNRFRIYGENAGKISGVRRGVGEDEAAFGEDSCREAGSMRERDKINTEGIPESMLHALYARAKESGRQDHHIYDEKAMELVERMDYDFSAAGQEIVMGRGVLARTILLDRMVSEYIERYPDASVVSMACGMDTRFYRVDNGRIRWYDLDLPVTIEARDRLLGAQERVLRIAESAMEDTWPEKVDTKGPVLIVAEGLSMYLDRQGVQKIFKIIRTHFTQAEVFLEAASPYTVKNAVENTGEGSRPKYTWGVKNGRQLQKMLTGFRAVKSVSLMEGLKEMYPAYHIIRLFPPMRNISNKIIVLRQTAAEEGAAQR